MKSQLTVHEKSEPEVLGQKDRGKKHIDNLIVEKFFLKKKSLPSNEIINCNSCQFLRQPCE